MSSENLRKTNNSKNTVFASLDLSTESVYKMISPKMSEEEKYKAAINLINNEHKSQTVVSKTLGMNRRTVKKYISAINILFKLLELLKDQKL